jgi:hypothetical protein
MNEIYNTYKDKVDFYLVYIREAHPSDGWQVRANLDDRLEFLEPRNQDERAELAGVCMIDLGFEMPMLLDNMDNEVDAKYAALPERLYVLNKDGIISFRGIMGSRGFDVETWHDGVQKQAALSAAQAAE